jgi:hypothetical protein
VTEDDLTRLGLTGCVLGETTTIEWPEPEDTAQGKGAAAGVALAVLAQVGTFWPLHLARLDELGVRIEYLKGVPGAPIQERRVFRFIGPPGVPLEIHPPEVAADPDACAPDTEDPDAVVIDNAKAPVVGFALPNGHVLLFELVQRHQRLTTAFRLPALQEIKPPVEEWMAAAGGGIERWLREQVDHHLKADRSWHNLVAAGLIARLAVSFDVGRSPAVVQEASARPRRWALDLNAKQLHTIERLLQAETLRLLADLDDLERTFALDDPDWQDDLLALCRSRDDIEGIRILLNEAHAPERAAAIQVLDADAILFMSSLPVKLTLDDERLRAVAGFDADAWWVSVVTESPG